MINLKDKMHDVANTYQAKISNEITKIHQRLINEFDQTSDFQKKFSELMKQRFIIHDKTQPLVRMNLRNADMYDLMQRYDIKKEDHTMDNYIIRRKIILTTEMIIRALYPTISDFECIKKTYEVIQELIEETGRIVGFQGNYEFYDTLGELVFEEESDLIGKLEEEFGISPVLLDPINREKIKLKLEDYRGRNVVIRKEDQSTLTKEIEMEIDTLIVPILENTRNYSIEIILENGREILVRKDQELTGEKFDYFDPNKKFQSNNKSDEHKGNHIVENVVNRDSEVLEEELKYRLNQSLQNGESERRFTIDKDRIYITDDI